MNTAYLIISSNVEANKPLMEAINRLVPHFKTIGTNRLGSMIRHGIEEFRIKTYYVGLTIFEKPLPKILELKDVRLGNLSERVKEFIGLCYLKMADLGEAERSKDGDIKLTYKNSIYIINYIKGEPYLDCRLTLSDLTIEFH